MNKLTSEAEQYFQELNRDKEATQAACLHIDNTIEQSLAIQNDGQDIRLLLSLIPYIENGNGELPYKYIGETHRILRILHIIQMEQKYHMPLFCSGCTDKASLIEKYMLTLFTFRRLLFHLSDTSVEDAISYLQQNPVSVFAVYVIVQDDLILPDNTLYSKITEIYSDKIYMHQDVFILNRNLLADLLAIFQSDSKIGMVGMVGYDSVAPDGIMWHTPQNRGNIYQKNPAVPYPALSEYQYSLAKDGFHLVAEIDGFLMATSHDLPWNTELLKDWDFYDAFQSINFLHHGYKIAVPVQRHPWCLHDDSKFLNMEKYDEYRHIFMETFREYLGKHYSEIL